MKMNRWLLALALVAAAPFASAKTCAVAIEGNDQMQYNLKEIKIAADCTEVEVTLKHVGKLPATAMGHNWVLTATPDMAAVGESTSVKFSTSILKKGGDYSFFCSFPGHWALMHGKLIFE